MSYFTQQFARPEPDPWKSAWRIDFERYMETRIPEKRAVPAPEPKTPAKKRIRTKSYRKHVVRRECANGCGNKLIARNTRYICWPCHMKERSARKRVCAQCSSPVNNKSKDLLCPDCYRQKIYERGRMNCEHPGCLERINRCSNPKRLNLCGWHHPESCTRSKYKRRSPKMEEAA